MFAPGNVVVNCQPGGTWVQQVPAPTTRYPTAAPTSAPPTALAPTRPPTSGPTTAPPTVPTVPTAPAPTSPPIDDLHAGCGSNFSCFTELNTPTGLGVFAHHPCEAEPKQNEPHISFGTPSTRQGITALVRGHGGVAGALRGGNATVGDDVMHIWILDQDGDTLCHQEYPANCNSRDPVLACSVGRTGEVVAVQAHVFCRRSGLYSGPVLNVAYEVYARSKEHSTSPSGVGPAYYHQAFNSVQQQIHSIESGRMSDTMVATEASQSIFVIELQRWLTLYNRQVSGNTLPGISSRDVHLLTNTQASNGVASILRRAWRSGCTFNASLIATPTSPLVGSGSCSLDDAVNLAMAFTFGADPNPVAWRPATQAIMTQVATAFRSSLPGAMSCIDETRPWAVLDSCLAPARDLFFTALGGSLRGAYHHHFVLAVHTLKYLNVLYTTSSLSELDPHLELNSSTGVYWCGVLGAGGSTTTLTTHTVDAIWIRDQRGAIVYFEDLTGSSGPPWVEFNRASLEYSATSLTPHQFSRSRGLWRGRDPLASPTVLFRRFTIGLFSPTGGPVPWGRYLSGGTPRLFYGCSYMFHLSGR